jgi:CBS domain containing-hemolysin-like protein
LLLKDFFKNKNNLKFSRIPVYSNSVENITGYVFRQEVFEKLAEDMDEMKLSDTIKRNCLCSGINSTFLHG